MAAKNGKGQQKTVVDTQAFASIASGPLHEDGSPWFAIKSERELLDRPLPKQLVDGLIVENSLVMLVAGYGVGKSFLALDLSLSVAAGQREFLGHPLRGSGPVLYVLAEGVGRFKLRVKAWKQFHQIADPLPFYWTNDVPNLLNEESVSRFVETVQRIRPTLVVLDTLSRCLVGADENNQAAMTQAVEACERIRTSGEKTGWQGPTVLILHHMNATGTRERGSTVMPAGVESQFYLKRAKRREHSEENNSGDRKNKKKEKWVTVPGQLRLTASKQKDLDADARPIKLHRQVVAIPDEQEESGAPATSVVWLADGAKGADAKEPILEIIEEQPGISKNALLLKIGGNRKERLKQLSTLGATGKIRIEQKGQTHHLFLAETVNPPQSIPATGPGESLRDSHSGTTDVAKQAKPVQEPENLRKSRPSNEENRRRNRVQSHSAGTASKNHRRAGSRPSGFRQAEA